MSLNFLMTANIETGIILPSLFDMIVSILLLLGAMALVLGGILVFRLHAFLALVFASLLISSLTPAWLTQGFYVSANGGSEDLSVSEMTVPGNKRSGIVANQPVIILRKDSATRLWKDIASGTVKPTDSDPSHLSLIVDGSTELQDGDAVIGKSTWEKVESSTSRSVGSRIASGFGNTAGKIGVLIALASVIGSCLMVSGSAGRIIHSLVGFFGAKRASIGFVIGSFIVGIPVFFDTVFYLMIPLARAYYREHRKGYLLCVLSIVAGATMAHSLVPPTPGPLQVASELGVSVGLMMICGLGMGMVTVTAGYILALTLDKRNPIPCRSIEAETESSDSEEKLDLGASPSLFAALIPILLPVLLISAGTVASLDSKSTSPKLSETTHEIISFVSNKNIALALSTVFALFLAAKYRRKNDSRKNDHIHKALMSGGVILLITAGGGAFGQVLKETGITMWAGDLAPGGTPWTILLAFGVTTIIRIAQGSATVAMVTAVGVVQPLVASGTLGFHPVYLALAIGCGSKPIPWMNDSGFWIISKMGGFTEKETLKSASLMMTTMGVVGGLVVFILAWLFPGV